MRRFSTMLFAAITTGAPQMAESQARFADPFSKDEWVTVYRLTMSESEAHKFYDEQQGLRTLMRAEYETEVARGRPPSRASGMGIEPAFGVSYSLDDLVMLSLLSDETYKKVERLMASMGQWLVVDDEGTQLFQKRRDELRPWVTERLREIRGY